MARTKALVDWTSITFDRTKPLVGAATVMFNRTKPLVWTTVALITIFSEPPKSAHLLSNAEKVLFLHMNFVEL